MNNSKYGNYSYKAEHLFIYYFIVFFLYLYYNLNLDSNNNKYILL